MEKPGSINSWVSVYEFLKDRIIKGIYGPGEKLNEREIAKLVNVSRTPTREALRVLEHEGFVTNITKRGFFCKKIFPRRIGHASQNAHPIGGSCSQGGCPQADRKRTYQPPKDDQPFEVFSIKEELQRILDS